MNQDAPPEMSDLAGKTADKAFATWCVMTHARPVLIRALRAWGMKSAAATIESAASLQALQLRVKDASFEVRQFIQFQPLRRDLSHATSTLNAAVTFARRGDAENTAAVVIGVFTAAASALSWRRPWTRFGWKQRRAQVIADAVREQREHKDQTQT